MCDMQLASLLADDVTKEKNKLRLSLLELKNEGKDTPLSMITLTQKEKRDCYENALWTVTCNLPEETRNEYRREIRKIHASIKQARNEVREALLAGTTKKKPAAPLEQPAESSMPITDDVHFELIMQDAQELYINALVHANIIELSEDGDMIVFE